MAESEDRNHPGVVTKLSSRSVVETVARLTALIAGKGMRLFAVIDQAEAAQQAGLELRETVLVLFGSPLAGTPIMAASPLSALDLPLRVLIWSDEGRTKVSYYSPTEIAARHGLSAELARNIAGIDPLTDLLVSP